MGRLEEIKGVVPLLEACAQVPHVKLVLAGSVGKSLAGKLPSLLPPNAAYVGLKQRGELRDLLSNALAVVVPSIWYENQPFSILEAFAAGRPVIASNLGGVKELIEDSRGGLLVAPANAEELASAIRWMMAQPREAEAMGARAFAYARKVHNAAVHYERLRDLYDRVGKG